MTAGPRETYLAGLEPAFASVAIALADAVEAAAPELTPRISYKMLMYIHGPDLSHFVVAIDRTTKVVALRFLHGAWLSDERKLLRGGTSHLSTIDFAPGAVVDAEVVAGYVREASARHAEFRARAESERAAAKGTG